MTERYFLRDYSWSAIFKALNKWFITGACVFAALLFRPLGVLGLHATISTYADAFGFPFIEGLLISFIAGMVSSRLMLSIQLQWSTIGFTLVKQLWNIFFFWGALWMILLILIRSYPEVEHGLAEISIQ
jgi:hypothetical protein